MTKIKFDWTKSVECQFTNETLSTDTLDRAIQASYLTDYLSIYKNTSYVLNINSEWGSGKSYFLKRWANSIRNNHPVIYFDAWSNDFHNEPLTLILGEIIEQLESLIKGRDRQNKIKALVQHSGNVLKATAPELAKGIVKKLVNVDVSSISQRVEDQENETIAADTLSASTKALLSLHKQQQSSIAELKSTIQSILEDVICSENSDQQSRWSPMYIFIDELDRCRPTFAVELLEVVKHIFSMDKVIFVVATDTEQLQHSIKAIYGQGFDSEKYLGRFFNRSFTLASPCMDTFIEALPSSEVLIKRIIATNSEKIIQWDVNNAVSFIAKLFECLVIDLRSASQIIDRVSSVLIHNNGDINPIWLLSLECIRVFNLDSFNALVTGRIITSGSNDQHKYFFNLIKERSKDSGSLNKILIEPTLSDNWNNSALKDITKSNGNVKVSARREVNTDRYSISKLLMLIINFHNSANAPDYANSHNVNIFELYLWVTKGNLSKYRHYIEVASNLS